MIDYHIHTHVSGDCDVQMLHMARAAHQKGLKQICFTDHIDIDLPCDIAFAVDFDVYRRVFDAAQTAYPDIEMRLGIEAGTDMRSIERMADILAANEIDFVIGSQHVVLGYDPFDKDMWSRYTQRQVFDAYLRESIESAGACDFYDVLGHIGYVSKGCTAEDKMMRQSDYSDAIDTLLKIVIDKGKGIEANTSGLRVTPSTLPETNILRRYFELGGQIITVGSDAHFEDAVGHAVCETLDVLKHIGFKYVCAFDKHVPRFIPIP